MNDLADWQRWSQLIILLFCSVKAIFNGTFVAIKIKQMKKVLLFLAIAVTTISNAQNLSQAERERCKEDIKYNLEMAGKGYGEAEYMLALRFHYTDPYDEANKAFWTPYDSKDPFVAAAYWLKKSCEHNWETAYDLYAEYCYYGRGNAPGGVLETLKWTNKALEKDSLNWSLQANQAICMWIIDEDKFYTDENFFYPRLILNSPNMEGAKSEFAEKFALICYHGLGDKKKYPQEAYLFFMCAYNTSASQNEVNTKALYYLIDCYLNGFGTDKDEETANKLINGIIKYFNLDVDWSSQSSVEEATTYVMNEIYKQISGDKERMTQYKSFRDIFNVLF